MRGTSRSGWAAVAIAADRVGLPRDEALARVAEVDFVDLLDRGKWRVAFRVGGLPAFAATDGLPAAHQVREQYVSREDVDHALAAHPDKPRITKATIHETF